MYSPAFDGHSWLLATVVVLGVGVVVSRFGARDTAMSPDLSSYPVGIGKGHGREQA